jgi:hypothetical protein
VVAVICGAEAALGLKALAGAAQGREAADGGGQGAIKRRDQTDGPT